MTNRLEVLRRSVAHLQSVVDRLDVIDYQSPAYPTAWSIADTLSHVGSGSVIMHRTFDDVIYQRTPDGDFNQMVWDEWNAKSPGAQVADAVVATRELLEALESSSAAQRDDFRAPMGPLTLDFNTFVGLRLNEQALHTWDVEVTQDRAAVLSSDAAGEIIESLSLIVRFAGKVDGTTRTVRVRTLDPSRDFTVVYEADSVSLVDATHDGAVDLELPAEAFARLVYGRLDPEHTPNGIDEVHLDLLRRTFPGI